MSPMTPDDPHAWNPKTGNCVCGWEPSTAKGAEREHAGHVEQELRS